MPLNPNNYKVGDVDPSTGLVFLRMNIRGPKWISTKELFDYRKKRAREMRDSHSKNREKRLESSRKWLKKNMQKAIAYNKSYAKRNPEKYLEWQRRASRKSYIKNIAQKKSYMKKRRDSGRSAEYSREWVRKRESTDPMYKIQRRLRTRVRAIFRSKGIRKNQSALKILGVNLSEAKEHIQSQFKDGMAWNNYGKWHLDHKVPLSSALNVEELIMLCHYTNLQPLWAKDNLIKNNRYEHAEKEKFMERMKANAPQSKKS